MAVIPSNTPKTRFAPSPTGLMHFGNARTALFNALYAEHLGGTCLLRIEDTDTTRSEPRFTQAIMDDLAWLDLPWEGDPATGKPVHQSERNAIYEGYYQQLIDMGRAYYCYCTEQELAVSRKVQLMRGQPPRYAGTCRHLTEAEVVEKIKKGVEPALRFRVESGKTVLFTDVIRGPHTFLSDDIGDFIIRRSNGNSAFFFCNAIDDALMGVTYALRGEDHLTNTPRQIMILAALGLPVPQYGHFPTILGADGSPLSKRNGSRSIQELREAGFHPKGVLNYMARLGHYYADNTLMDVSSLASNFSLEHVGHSPAHFDEAQLMHWQREAMHKGDLSDFIDFVQPYCAQWKDNPLFNRFVEVIQPNITMPQEAAEWADCLLSKDYVLPEEMQTLVKAAGPDFIRTAIDVLKAQPKVDYTAWIKAIQDNTGLKGKQLYLPVRVIMTRQSSGPELEKVFYLLGPEALMARFKEFES